MINYKQLLEEMLQNTEEEMVEVTSIIPKSFKEKLTELHEISKSTADLTIEEFYGFHIIYGVYKTLNDKRKKEMVKDLLREIIDTE